MINLFRRTERYILRQSVRHFAEVVGRAGTPYLPDAPNGKEIRKRIPVKEDHGLYAFFRRKERDDLVGDARFATFDPPTMVQTGRSWKSAELRLKSFKELHTLWYIVLRERNLLATQEEELRRMGALSHASLLKVKTHACRKTMARIKGVLNERRLAYEGAIRIAKEKQEEIETTVVLREQLKDFKADKKMLRKRRLELRALKRSQNMQELPDEGEARLNGQVIEEPMEEIPSAATTEEPGEHITAVTNEDAKHKTRAKAPSTGEGASCPFVPPRRPVEIASSGVFGELPRGDSSKGRS